MKNRSFWVSLFVLVLLMCSCKTKKLDSNVRIRNDIRSDLSYMNKSFKISTSNTAYFANDTQRIVIEEDIVVKEYDKESGKPIKETNAKRKTTQDSDKVVSSSETKGVKTHSQDSLNHFADVSKMVESETEEESIGGQKSFGKWLGFVIGLGVVIGIIYICKRINLL